MAFGTGSAVAHRAVDAVMGPRTIQHEGVETADSASASAAPAAGGMFSSSCDLHAKAFQDVSSVHYHSYYFHYNISCDICLHPWIPHCVALLLILF